MVGLIDAKNGDVKVITAILALTKIMIKTSDTAGVATMPGTKTGSAKKTYRWEKSQKSQHEQIKFYNMKISQKLQHNLFLFKNRNMREFKGTF